MLIACSPSPNNIFSSTIIGLLLLILLVKITFLVFRTSLTSYTIGVGGKYWPRLLEVIVMPTVIDYYVVGACQT